MKAPFHRLLLVQRNEPEAQSCLVAATGASLWVFNGTTGGLLSKWPARVAAADEGRPPKRRKTVDADETASSNPSKAEALPSRSSFITNLITTSDGRHMVASTAEDKLICVFQLSNDGMLRQLSKRQMVKRPCAITLTPDEDSIIVADRFGDVYSLPLLWDEEAENRFREHATAKPSSSEPWKPAADFSTVHTKGNVQALKNQQTMKKSTIPKEPVMDFEHDFLLGHVSMLTDVIMAQITTPSGPRRYIITADRDEHIRLSRGPPQSYVIEGFLLGHDELVNRLHIPKWNPEILISGGGDDYLLVWDWAQNKILQKVDVRASMLKLLHDETNDPPFPGSREDEQKPMVKNIWSTKALGGRDIVISLEAAPLLLVFRMHDEGTVSLHSAIRAGRNVLDAVICEDGSILFSSDHVHRPWRREPLEAVPKGCFVERVIYEKGMWSPSHADSLLLGMDEDVEEDVKDFDSTKLGEMLYGCESFRKRRMPDAEEDDAVNTEIQNQE